MEIYDNTPESFHEFVNLYISRGREEDGFVKNSFKFLFDVENEEKFLHLYLDNPEAFVTSDIDRIQFYAQNYLEGVYKAILKKSSDLLSSTPMQEQEENEKSLEKSQESEKSEAIEPQEKEISAVEGASETQSKEIVDPEEEHVPQQEASPEVEPEKVIESQKEIENQAEEVVVGGEQQEAQEEPAKVELEATNKADTLDEKQEVAEGQTEQEPQPEEPVKIEQEAQGEENIAEKKEDNEEKPQLEEPAKVEQEVADGEQQKVQEDAVEKQEVGEEQKSQIEEQEAQEVAVKADEEAADKQEVVAGETEQVSGEQEEPIKVEQETTENQEEKTEQEPQIEEQTQVEQPKDDEKQESQIEQGETIVNNDDCHSKEEVVENKENQEAVEVEEKNSEAQEANSRKEVEQAEENRDDSSEKQGEKAVEESHNEESKPALVEVKEEEKSAVLETHTEKQQEVAENEKQELTENKPSVGELSSQKEVDVKAESSHKVDEKQTVDDNKSEDTNEKPLVLDEQTANQDDAPASEKANMDHYLENHEAVGDQQEPEEGAVNPKIRDLNLPYAIVIHRNSSPLVTAKSPLGTEDENQDTARSLENNEDEARKPAIKLESDQKEEQTETETEAEAKISEVKETQPEKPQIEQKPETVIVKEQEKPVAEQVTQKQAEPQKEQPKKIEEKVEPVIVVEQKKEQQKHVEKEEKQKVDVQKKEEVVPLQAPKEESHKETPVPVVQKKNEAKEIEKSVPADAEVQKTDIKEQEEVAQIQTLKEDSHKQADDSISEKKNEAKEIEKLVPAAEIQKVEVQKHEEKPHAPVQEKKSEATKEVEKSIPADAEVQKTEVKKQEEVAPIQTLKEDSHKQADVSVPEKKNEAKQIEKPSPTVEVQKQEEKPHVLVQEKKSEAPKEIEKPVPAVEVQKQEEKPHGPAPEKKIEATKEVEKSIPAATEVQKQEEKTPVAVITEKKKESEPKKESEKPAQKPVKATETKPEEVTRNPIQPTHEQKVSEPTKKKEVVEPVKVQETKPKELESKAKLQPLNLIESTVSQDSETQKPIKKQKASPPKKEKPGQKKSKSQAAQKTKVEKDEKDENEPDQVDVPAATQTKKRPSKQGMPALKDKTNPELTKTESIESNLSARNQQQPSARETNDKPLATRQTREKASISQKKNPVPEPLTETSSKPQKSRPSLKNTTPAQTDFNKFPLLSSSTSPMTDIRPNTMSKGGAVDDMGKTIRLGEGFTTKNKSQNPASRPKLKVGGFMESKPEPQQQYSSNLLPQLSPKSQHQQQPAPSQDKNDKKYITTQQGLKRALTHTPVDEQEEPPESDRPQTMWKKEPRGKIQNTGPTLSKTTSQGEFSKTATGAFFGAKKDKNPTSSSTVSMKPQMIGSRINFKPDPNPSNPPRLYQSEVDSQPAVPRRNIVLPNAPNRTKVTTANANSQAEMFEGLGASNPYNTKWFRSVLKNHFDVDLEPNDDDHHAKWRIRKVKNPKKLSRASHETDDVDVFENANFPKEFANIGGFNANFSSKNTITDSNFFKNSRAEKRNSKLNEANKNQPSVNNFIAGSGNANGNANGKNMKNEARRLPSLNKQPKEKNKLRSEDFKLDNQESAFNIDPDNVYLTQTLPIYHPDFLGNLQLHNIKSFGDNLVGFNSTDIPVPMPLFSLTK